MKIYYLILTGILFGVLSTAYAVCTDLSATDIEAALTYGRQHGAKAQESLNRQYCIGSCDLFSEHILIRTKWHKLASIAAVSADQEREITPQDITLITGDTNLQIDTIVYGNSMHFAREYSVVLLQDGRTITPVKMHADHFTEKKHGKAAAGFPSYRATIRSYFPYSVINLQAPAKLAVKKDGRECTFTIDFKKFQ